MLDFLLARTPLGLLGHDQTGKMDSKLPRIVSYGRPAVKKVVTPGPSLEARISTTFSYFK